MQLYGDIHRCRMKVETDLCLPVFQVSVSCPTPPSLCEILKMLCLLELDEHFPVEHFSVGKC